MPNSRFVFHTPLLFIYLFFADLSLSSCWLKWYCLLIGCLTSQAEASAEAGVLFPRRSAAEKEENEEEEQHKFLYWEALVC